MTPDFAGVQRYYDEHVVHKLRDFVEGNHRIEKAWHTLATWSTTPRRILEIGCGTGSMAWRMKRYWPLSEVVGLDVSPRSLEVAQSLFGDSGITFVQGPLAPGLLTGPFDLVVMVDVYEHIPVPDRAQLHAAIRELIAPLGRMMLAFPTPRHLAWLKAHLPDQIQPVDEDIDAATIQTLADDIGKEVLFYQQVDVWHEGDYAHAIVGGWEGWRDCPAPPAPPSLAQRLRRRLAPPPPALIPPRAERLALVHARLGKEAYPG